MAPKYHPPWRLLLISLYSLFCGFMLTLNILRILLTKGLGSLTTKVERTRPDILQNDAYGTHHFARLKDINLHYVASGPEDRPLLLFIHGFPEFWYSWRFQIKEFNTKYRVVAVDMRGYSESDKPSGVASYHLDKLANDIRHLIQHLGYTKCYLVSHDWGAIVSWIFACKYPSMVDKFVACNGPNPWCFERFMVRHPSQLGKSWYMFLFQLPFLADWFLGTMNVFFIKAGFRPVLTRNPQNITDEDLDAYRYTFNNMADRTGGINYYRALLRYQRPKLANHVIKAPALIIWGCKDEFLEQEVIGDTKRYFNNCTLRYIRQCSHWVQQEEPEMFNGYLRDFLLNKTVRE